jgi:hypothetical protein
MLELRDYQPDAGDSIPQQRRENTAAQAQEYEEIWLLGQPPLSRYLEWIEDTVIGGASLSRAALTTEWCAANDYYQELERSEAGIANEVECRALDPSLALLAAQVQAHPHYRNTFDLLPTTIGVVELDRLMVFQKHITRNFVDALTARIGPAADPAALFRFCHPLGQSEAPVEVRRIGSKRYVFRCHSTDFRFHEPTLLRADQVKDYGSFGPIAGIVGLVVGFGSNFLNVLRVGKRLLLNNGYHRACALRALGITHAPSVIQTATRADELEAAAGHTAEDAEFYFESARPPLLKDYFDPKIRKLWPIHRRERIIEVNFEIKNFLVP